mgnify:CR=1 FL=1
MIVVKDLVKRYGDRCAVDHLSFTIEEGKLFFATLAYSSEVILQKDKTGIVDDAVSVVIANATLYMPFAELVDIAQEKERLNKEMKRLEGELARVNGMLNNERFISKAPDLHFRSGVTRPSTQKFPSWGYSPWSPPYQYMGLPFDASPL